MVKKREINRKVKGDKNAPRISVFRSNTNIFAQVIDDEDRITLVSASTLSMKNGGNVEAARAVGKEIAEKAKKKDIDKVVFDRGRYTYKGRVKALAESARENGLVF
jgi:large subunit ribosomal protein L18